MIGALDGRKFGKVRYPTRERCADCFKRICLHRGQTNSITSVKSTCARQFRSLRRLADVSNVDRVREAQRLTMKAPSVRDWPVPVIPNCLDTDRWKPMEQSLARKLLGLPADAPLLLFGVMGDGRDPRKGFDLLLQALMFSAISHCKIRSSPIYYE